MAKRRIHVAQKIKDEDLKELLRMYDEGVSITRLATRFRVTRQTIYNTIARSITSV